MTIETSNDTATLVRSMEGHPFLAPGSDELERQLLDPPCTLQVQANTEMYKHLHREHGDG